MAETIPPLRVVNAAASFNQIPVFELEFSGGTLTKLSPIRAQYAPPTASVAGHSLDAASHTDVSAVTEASGQFLYFSKHGPAGGPPGVWRIPIKGGEEVQVLEHALFREWALWEDSICYLNREVEAGLIVECLDLITGTVSPLAALVERRGYWGLSVSPDGRWIIYGWLEFLDDIMLVENFR